MIRVLSRNLIFSLVFIILLHDRVESQSSSYGLFGGSWSNRYNGHTVEVPKIHTYYRGGGFGLVYSSSEGSSQVSSQSKASETSTMTTKNIREKLFNGDLRIPSKEIFDYKDNIFRRNYGKDGKKDHNLEMSRIILAGTVFGAQAKASSEGKQPSDAIQKLIGAMEEAKKDQIVTVRDEKNAVLVGSIPYFWGERNLPQGDNPTDCVDFSAANVANNFTICNVATLRRCHKSLKEVVIIARQKNVWDSDFNFDSDKAESKIDVKNADGTNADNFSWFCPGSDDCCEWECCYMETENHKEYIPPDAQFVSTVHLSIALIAIVAAIILCCCIHKCFMISDNKLSANAHNQSVAENEPLADDYPKQPPRKNMEGKYGWNLTPSAPM